MGTKDITPVEFKRIVLDHKYLPGDVLSGWERDYRLPHTKFTFTNRHPEWQTKVCGVTDDGAEVEFMIGCVERWHDQEEIDLAIKNAKAAGFAWQKGPMGFGDSFSWWNASEGHGYGSGQEDNPPGSMVDDFGWDANFCEECGKALERFKAGFCFHCKFWIDYVGDPEAIVINGYHYMDGGRKTGTQSSFLGFGGREFKVRMFDGRVISTNNMWGQGDIPERFRSRIPDNAEFVK